MIMTKEMFESRIEVGRVIQIGRFSCRMIDCEYCFFGEETEVFSSFEEFWNRVSGYILYGVNYFGENTE